MIQNLAVYASVVLACIILSGCIANHHEKTEANSPDKYIKSEVSEEATNLYICYENRKLVFQAPPHLLIQWEREITHHKNSTSRPPRISDIAKLIDSLRHEELLVYKWLGHKYPNLGPQATENIGAQMLAPYDWLFGYYVRVLIKGVEDGNIEWEKDLEHIGDGERALYIHNERNRLRQLGGQSRKIWVVK